MPPSPRLTGRYGDGSKLVVCGDPDQCDRKTGHWVVCGLDEYAREVEMGNMSDAWACVRLPECHRHPLCKESKGASKRIEARRAKRSEDAAAGRSRATNMMGGPLRHLEANTHR